MVSDKDAIKCFHSSKFQLQDLGNTGNRKTTVEIISMCQ